MAKNRKQRRAAKFGPAGAAGEVAITKQKALGPGGISCRGCPYWLVEEGEDRKKIEQASCVRLPAVLIPERQLIPGIGGQLVAVDTGNNLTRFPSMMWFGICGEHPEWPK